MVEPSLATTLNPDITPMGRFLFGLIVYGPILLLMASPFAVVIYWLSTRVESSPADKTSPEPPGGTTERLTLLMVLMGLTPILYGVGAASSWGHSALMENDNFLIMLLAIFGPPATVWGWPQPIKNKFSGTRVFLICLLAVCLYHWLCHLSWILAPELLR